MKPLAPGGFLVAVEGVDGAGKTTVCALLAQHCGERGIACALSKEPTGLSYGRQLRESARTGRLSVEEELELFLKDRIDHAVRSIRPALDYGAVVILDRYYWSTAAYQGARGIDPFEIVAQNEARVPRPDLVLLLDVEPTSGLDRVRIRGDIPNEFEKAQALAEARTIFNRLHDRFPEFSKKLNAGDSLRSVHRAALAAFLDVAGELLTRRDMREEDAGEMRALLSA